MHRLCGIADVQEGTPLRVTAPGYEPLAVCVVDGSFYVIADTCSHGMASLSEGEIEGMQIFCPFHGGAFDIATGKPTERPCTIAIATYRPLERESALWLPDKA